MKLTSKIQKAIVKSSVLHFGQKRKDADVPYITHPYSVAFILTNYTDDEDIIVAGLLHDVLEDVPGCTMEDIKRDFGDKIAQIVKEVSEDKDPDDSPEKAKATWEQRKKEYLDNLKNDSFEAMMVCAADKIHNLKSIAEAYKEQGEKLFDNFNAPIDKKMWYYGEVLKILEGRLNNDIIKELKEVYSKSKDLLK
ncbi:MAG: HD domain-containing protein [Candidatus Doudnabacteria bacterium]